MVCARARWLEPPAVQGPFCLLESDGEDAAPARGAVALALCALPALSAGGFFALGWADHSVMLALAGHVTRTLSSVRRSRATRRCSTG